MSILQEAMANPKVEDFVPPVDPAPEANSPGLKIDFSGLWEIFKKPVGDGDLKDYQESPLSFNSKGLGRVLWGVSGLISYALKDVSRSAVVQILVGMFEMAKERRGANA